MPKELQEIKHFNVGTHTTTSEVDIPDNAATQSVNIDPVSRLGKLTPIPEDKTMGVATTADTMIPINDDGTEKTIVIESTGDKKFKVIEGLYGDSPSITNISGTAEAITTIASGEVNNKEVHFGMGNAPAMWVGDIQNSQFGGDAPGMTATAANLDFPQASGRSRDIFYDSDATIYYTLNNSNGIDSITAAGVVVENAITFVDTTLYRMCPVNQGSYDVMILGKDATNQHKLILYDFGGASSDINNLTVSGASDFDAADVTQMINDVKNDRMYLYSKPSPDTPIDGELIWADKPTFLWKTGEATDSATSVLEDVDWKLENRTSHASTHSSDVNGVGEFWLDNTFFAIKDTSASDILHGLELTSYEKRTWSFHNGTVKLLQRDNGDLWSFLLTSNKWAYVATFTGAYTTGTDNRTMHGYNESDGAFAYRSAVAVISLHSVNSSGVFITPSGATGIESSFDSTYISRMNVVFSSTDTHLYVMSYFTGAGNGNVHYEMAYNVSTGISDKDYVWYPGAVVERSFMYAAHNLTDNMIATVAFGSGGWVVYKWADGDAEWSGVAITNSNTPALVNAPDLFQYAHCSVPIGTQDSSNARWASIVEDSADGKFYIRVYKLKRLSSSQCELTQEASFEMSRGSSGDVYVDMAVRDANNIDVIEYNRDLEGSTTWFYTILNTSNVFTKENEFSVKKVDDAGTRTHGFDGTWDTADKTGIGGIYNAATSNWVCLIPQNGYLTTHLVKKDKSNLYMSNRPMWVALNADPSNSYFGGVCLRLASDARYRSSASGTNFSTWFTAVNSVIFLINDADDEYIGKTGANTKLVVEDSTDETNDFDNVDFIMGGIAADRIAVTGVTVSATLTAVDGGSGRDSITRPSGSWISDGFRAGQIITSGAWADGSNNADFVIYSVTATILTLTSLGVLTGATEAATVEHAQSLALFRYNFDTKKIIYLNDNNIDGMTNATSMTTSIVDLSSSEHIASLTGCPVSNNTIVLANTTTKGFFQNYEISGDDIDTYTVLADDIITIDPLEDGQASTYFMDNTKYFYKASFVFDGYQEGPLSTEFTEVNDAASGPAGQNMNVALTLKNVATALSPRITHVNIYRAAGETADSDASLPLGFYRQVRHLALDSSWATSGVNKTLTFNDTGTEGASYESSSGLSEALDSTTINYSVSTQLNNHHFIGGCYMAAIESASNYIFKSMPYNFDQFDWTKDALKIGSTPTAMKAFNGRVYVFDENNTYRIEPNSFYIEDKFEGVGCLNKDSVVVTEYGMFFADKNNLYLHDGQTPKPIGNAILKGDTYSWTGASVNKDNTKVWFDALRNSYIVSFEYTSSNYAWAYNLSQGRWDKWEGDDEAVKGVFHGKNGEMFVTTTSLKQYLGDTNSYRKWSWYSKEITGGHDTQNKRWRSIKTTGNHAGALGTNVFLVIDGTLTSTAGWTGDINDFKIPSANSTAKKITIWFLEMEGELEALGFVYRRKPIK